MLIISCQGESHIILQTERLMLRGFVNPINQSKTAYGENFYLIQHNGLLELKGNSVECQSNYSFLVMGAIAVDNLLVRTLPTNDPLFYNSKIAGGEGYPFDNLQKL